MRSAVPQRLAAVIWGLVAALTLATILFVIWNEGRVSEEAGFANVSTSSELVAALVALACSTIGAVVAARRPQNLIGWTFLGAGFTLQFENFGSNYAIYASVVAPGSLAGERLVALLADAMWLPSMALAFVYVMLLFPTGCLPSPRWRPVFVLATIGALLSFPVTLFAPEPLYYLPDVPNPLGIPAAKGLLDVLYGVSFLGVLLPVPASFVALILRARRSRGDERQQMKWFVYAAALLVGAFLVALVFDESQIVSIGFEAATAGFPVALGLAILRYRLYDIDRIINRTLVYGALSAVLAGIYGLCVVVVPRTVGVGRRSDIVVAGSTLLVAALFQPARRRIQSFIDRRFYRSRYDAQRTAEAFGARLRSEVQIDQVSSDLLGVVRHTMQPSHASVWLRAEAEAR